MSSPSCSSRSVSVRLPVEGLRFCLYLHPAKSKRAKNLHLVQEDGVDYPLVVLAVPAGIVLQGRSDLKVSNKRNADSQTHLDVYIVLFRLLFVLGRSVGTHFTVDDGIRTVFDKAIENIEQRSSSSDGVGRFFRWIRLEKEADSSLHSSII